MDTLKTFLIIILGMFIGFNCFETDWSHTSIAILVGWIVFGVVETIIVNKN